jgi:hypothetical protein
LNFIIVSGPIVIFMATEICSEKIVITEIPLSIHRYPIGIIVKSIKCYFWFDIIALLAILHFCYSTLWLPNTKPPTCN